jgi:hypothetical protein
LSLPLFVAVQYFTDDEAGRAIASGAGSSTGGLNYAMDFAPVFVGYQNCQDLDVAELHATAVVLERGGGCIYMAAACPFRYVAHPPYSLR